MNITETIPPEMWPENTILAHCGEVLKIHKNYGGSGEVMYLDDSFLSNKWYWHYDGEVATPICFPIETESDHKAMLDRVSYLMDHPEASKCHNEISIIAAVIERYESETFIQ